MFEAATVKQLNDLETLVFNAIIKEPIHVQSMTIRELASETHVSTSTIVRLCGKLGFEGWAELKYYLKNELNPQKLEKQHYDNMMEFDLFLKFMYSKGYQARIAKAAQLVADADYIIFCGVGSSGSLSDYGMKYFVNIGLNSFVISDPFLAIQVPQTANVVAIVLSESGDTAQVVNKTVEFRNHGAKIISITNSEENAIARLADLRLSYNLAFEWSKQYPLGNLTTQLPVLAILEVLAHRASALKSEK